MGDIPSLNRLKGWLETVHNLQLEPLRNPAKGQDYYPVVQVSRYRKFAAKDKIGNLGSQPTSDAAQHFMI